MQIKDNPEKKRIGERILMEQLGYRVCYCQRRRDCFTVYFLSSRWLSRADAASRIFPHLAYEVRRELHFKIKQEVAARQT